MALVKIMVGGRQYTVSCRDGDEDRLHNLASVMTDKITQVKTGTQNLTEVRQLLFAGLLLADALSEKAAPAPKAAAPPPPDETEALARLAGLAERIEALGDSLAAQLPNA